MNYITEQAVTEMRYEYDKLLSFADVLDSKLALLMEGAVVVLTAFAAVGIVKDSPLGYWIALEAIAVIFAIGIVTVAVYWAPWRYPFALPANWDQLARHYLDLGDDEAREVVISQYIVVIDKVKPILEKKARAVTVGLIAIAVSLVILVGLQLAYAF